MSSKSYLVICELIDEALRQAQDALQNNRIDDAKGLLKHIRSVIANHQVRAKKVTELQELALKVRLKEGGTESERNPPRR